MDTCLWRGVHRRKPLGASLVPFCASRKEQRSSTGQAPPDKKVGVTQNVTPTGRIEKSNYQDALEELEDALPLELLLESPELSPWAAVTSFCTVVRRAVSWV